MLPLIPLATNIDLSGAWDTLWGAVTASTGPILTNVLSVLGVIILVLAIFGYIWSRARGRGNAGGLVWAIVIGAVLAAPGVVFPILLTLIDLVINAVIDIVNAAAK